MAFSIGVKNAHLLDLTSYSNFTLNTLFAKLQKKAIDLKANLLTKIFSDFNFKSNSSSSQRHSLVQKLIAFIFYLYQIPLKKTNLDMFYVYDYWVVLSFCTKIILLFFFFQASSECLNYY